jgi:5-carboxymethyl-2-hydroxymuconate isomerase
MPHLVILYTGNLDAATDMSALCRSLADTMLAANDDAGKPVFPPGGTRVLAYPAPHFAVSDGGMAGRAATEASGDTASGKGDYAFVYLNLRMASGRTPATHKRVGDALLMATKAHFQPVFAQRYIGVTLQIDEGNEVFDAKHSNLHPLFQK